MYYLYESSHPNTRWSWNNSWNEGSEEMWKNPLREYSCRWW